MTSFEDLILRALHPSNPRCGDTNSPSDPSWAALMPFGTLVKDLRSRLGVNQMTFAAGIGVTASAVSRWEADRSLPSEPAVARIRDLCHRISWQPPHLLETFDASTGHVPAGPFGSAVAAARTRAQLTTNEAAYQAGVQVGVWRRWERSEVTPSLRAVPTIVRVLSCPSLGDDYTTLVYPHARPGSFEHTLIRCRVMAGLSQEEVAHRARLHRNTLKAWELGNQRPTPRSLQQVATVLGIDAAALTLTLPTVNDPDRTESRFQRWLRTRADLTGKVGPARYRALVGGAAPSAADLAELGDGDSNVFEVAVAAVLSDLAPDPSAPYATAGKLLLDARLRSRIRLADLAAQVGVVPGAWRRWERGLTAPSQEHAAAVEQLTGVPALSWGERRTRPSRTRTRLGERIRAARLSSNLTLAAFAAQVGASMSTVCSWEAGVAVPSHRFQKVLSRDFQVPFADGSVDENDCVAA